MTEQDKQAKHEMTEGERAFEGVLIAVDLNGTLKPLYDCTPEDLENSALIDDMKGRALLAEAERLLAEAERLRAEAVAHDGL